MGGSRGIRENPRVLAGDTVDHGDRTRVAAVRNEYMYVVHYPTWTPLMKAIFIKMRRMQHNMVLFSLERRGRYGIDKDIIYRYNKI